MKKSELKQLIKEEIRKVLKENRTPGLDELSKYVSRPDMYKSDFNVWEEALFYDYDKAMSNQFVGINMPKEEFNKLHNELQNRYNFNYFVRNWTVLDDEESRHEDEKGKDVGYFKDKYMVNDKIANIMKKIVDTTDSF